MRAKGKGFWKAQIMSAYQRGREDGAAKQEKNYEVGFHLGKKMGYEQGQNEIIDRYWDAEQFCFENPHTEPSLWERMCHAAP